MQDCPSSHSENNAENIIKSGIIFSKELKELLYCFQNMFHYHPHFGSDSSMSKRGSSSHMIGFHGFYCS